MKTSTYKLCAALAAALGILVFALHSPRPRQVAPAHERAAVEPISVAQQTAMQARGYAQTKLRLGREELRQVLPHVGGTIADWRDFKPHQLTVTPFPGMPLEFTETMVKTDGNRTTWVGKNPEQGVTLVACGTETLWNALILIPGADEIAIQITPEAVRVEEHPRTLVVCGEPRAGVGHTAELEAAPTMEAAVSAAAADTVYYADLLILYDSGTAAAIGTTEQIANTFATRVAAMNVYLNDSLVTNLQWRLVGEEAAPSYTTTGSLQDDLEELADPTTNLGRFARNQRSTYGADQVILMITGTRDYGGMAYTPGYLSVALYNQGSVTSAHELAHNFGCLHDRETEEVADSNGKYNYAHRFTNSSSQDVGTIMSYADYYIPYFSNPDVSYRGYVTGIAAGQPKAADNARWLRENADTVANLVASNVVEAPTITTQPTSVTVTAGNSFSLRVTASGSSLTYQWYKGTAAIAGATSATYTKTSSATSDAGTYYVVVTNTGGSVQSNSVTVTVNASTTTTTTGSSSGSSSSGGGGGGSFGLLEVIGLASLLRLCARRRR